VAPPPALADLRFFYYHFPREPRLCSNSFAKAIWVSQIATTLLYLGNGLFVYLLVGNASWLESPSSLSLQPGTAKNICQSLIIVYFCLSVLVDGTIFVRNIQNTFQPMFSVCLGRDEKETLPPSHQTNKDSEPDDYGATTWPEKMDYSKSFAAVAPPDDWRCSAISWWVVWSALTISVVTLVGLAIGDFDDILGLTAALIASQTTLSWPSFFHYHHYGRALPEESNCSKHGVGTGFCHCARRRFQAVADALIIAAAIVLFMFGLWANSQDIANHYQSKHPKLFSCSKLPLSLLQK
jgi:Transmembrane amino acid transporter protein